VWLLWSYFVLQIKLLQDDRRFEAVGCALGVERDVSLNTHDESLCLAAIDSSKLVMKSSDWK
jgi:hypothetical protein